MTLHHDEDRTMRMETTLIVAILICNVAYSVEGPGTIDRTIEALNAFDGFIIANPPATDRKKELGYDTLFDLVVKGPTADPAELKKFLDLYKSQTDGEDLPYIVKIRERLEEHIQAVRRNQNQSRQIVGSLPPITITDFDQFLATQQARLDASVARVERYLNNSGPSNAAGWKTFLEWDDLVAVLNEEKQDKNGSGRRYARITELREKFYGKTKGIGQDPFLELRERIDAYLFAVLLAKSTRTPGEDRLAKFLEDLDEAVTRYEWDYDPTARANIGLLTQRLKLAHQADGLVQKLRGRYWHPNIYVKVSEQLAGAGVNDVIQDVSPINEYMMKTTIRGTAHTQGGFRLAMAPSHKGISLAVCVNAHASAVSTGTRGKVRVHSTGQTIIEASKAMFFTEDGRLTAEPAYAKCTTSSQITGVSHKRKFVRRIAYNKAMKFKPVGENYASRKGEVEAVKQLDSQVVPLLKKANDAFENQVRRPLLGFDLFPKWHNLTSTYEALGGKALMANDQQLGAPNHPPALPSTPLAGSIRVHESALSNIADTLIRGYTLNNENAIELLKDLDREVPDELLKGEEWSMTFARRNAVVVKFEDNQIRVGFRGVEFSNKDTSEALEIEFHARYAVELQPRAVVLRRIGEVEADVITDKFVPPRQIGIRDAINAKFAAVFEPVITIKSRKLPKPYDKAGDILPAHFTAGFGWATVGFNAANVRLY